MDTHRLVSCMLIKNKCPVFERESAFRIQAEALDSLSSFFGFLSLSGVLPLS